MQTLCVILTRVARIEQLNTIERIHIIRFYLTIRKEIWKERGFALLLLVILRNKRGCCWFFYCMNFSVELQMNCVSVIFIKERRAKAIHPSENHKTGHHQIYFAACSFKTCSDCKMNLVKYFSDRSWTISFHFIL